MPLIVLKLGGSLLNCPDLAARLRHLLAKFKSSRVLVIVGGGESADVVRNWSDRFKLSDEAAHWLALRSLSVTRALVRTLLPEWGEVTTREEAIRFWKVQTAPLLLNLEQSLSLAESQGETSLPHTWDTTSDSIAAWVAQEWDAHELILLKSTALPRTATLHQACEADLVDANFPQFANQIPQVLWCNLLEDDPQLKRWLDYGVLQSS
jgi:aspartokinase-like uncharacterized kinase